jgi:hypothetical protein
MADKNSFTPTEWDLLRRAPLTASLVVAAASPNGPIGLIQESTAASKVILGAAQTAKTPLVQSLSSDLRQNLSLPHLPQGASPDQVRDAALQTLKESSDLVATKGSPEEAGEYREWLSTIAQQTAEAAKEGGFLGIGGTLVSDAEKAALEQIHNALGLPKAA